jgi:hypothetical protein
MSFSPPKKSTSSPNSPVEVEFQGTPFHVRQGRRPVVVLQPGRSNIDPETIAEDDPGGPETLVAPLSCFVALADLFGELQPVPFHDDVNVKVVPAQQTIPNHSPDEVCVHLD